ncbi:MAG: hypothetical protein JRE81_02260 [Deltaproteobacteria bacterium]|nr:hypothetical protein [Deltaproteobacteria bacterium]
MDAGGRSPECRLRRSDFPLLSLASSDPLLWRVAGGLYSVVGLVHGGAHAFSPYLVSLLCGLTVSGLAFPAVAASALGFAQSQAAD